MSARRERRATQGMGATSLTLLAPLQSCAAFCLEPETFPVFVAWLWKTQNGIHPPEWFDETEIHNDITEAHDAVGDIEDFAHAVMS